MNKAFALFVFFLLCSSLGFSQEKSKFNTLISGKWRLERMVFDDEKMELTGENHWMIFNSDGHYQLMLNQNEEKGTWKFSNAENEIQFDSAHTERVSKIERLTDNEFSISISDGDSICVIELKR